MIMQPANIHGRRLFGVQKISELSTFFVRYLDKIINRILFFLLLVMTIITFTQVCTRYVLGFSILWGEELCRYLFIWSIFIALPSLIFRSDLTSFDMLPRRVDGRVAKALNLSIAAGELVFLWLLCSGGYPLMMRQWGQRATSLPISIGFVYGIVPVSACFSMFVVFERVLRLFHTEGRSK
jgi:TRAP-type C4-dicarboxylate transport system permease small subunit